MATEATGAAVSMEPLPLILAALAPRQELQLLVLRTLLGPSNK